MRCNNVQTRHGKQLARQVRCASISVQCASYLVFHRPAVFQLSLVICALCHHNISLLMGIHLLVFVLHIHFLLITPSLKQSQRSDARQDFVFLVCADILAHHVHVLACMHGTSMHAGRATVPLACTILFAACANISGTPRSCAGMHARYFDACRTNHGSLSMHPSFCCVRQQFWHTTFMSWRACTVFECMQDEPWFPKHAPSSLLRAPTFWHTTPQPHHHHAYYAPAASLSLWRLLPSWRCTKLTLL